MTLEELSKAYYAAYWGIDTTNNNERDIAGIRAVVEALRAKVAEINAEDSLKTTADVMELLDEMIGPESECDCWTNGYAVCRKTYAGTTVCVRCGRQPKSTPEVYYDGDCI